MPKQAALPPTLPPRLIGRDAAAAYINVSPNTFDKMIEAGRMPRPRILADRRQAWDVRELDSAVDSLPHRGDSEPVDADEGWT
jgi:predicted DNA-binding transcriptional regulator AlpA